MRIRSAWYWLVPGMHVKRFVLLFIIGITLLFISLGRLLGTRGIRLVAGLELAFEGFLQRTLGPAFGSAVLVTAYAIAAGAACCLMVVAAYQLMKSVIRPLAGSAPREPLARTIYRYHRAGALPHVVVIGGGTGIAPVIETLREENVLLTAIVTMADSGGSSGRLRDAAGILPPGDFRNALIAMAGESSRSARLLSYRFPEHMEGIGGHNISNLIIAALSDIKGNFGDAVQEFAEVMQLPGRVLPMSLDSIRLKAHYTDGSTTEGEDQIPLQNKVIEGIEILPNHAKPFVRALESLAKADSIIIGPGSLYTSLIPPLSIEATADTIARSAAIKVLVVNAMTERGETDGYTAGMHLHRIEQVLGRQCIDMVLLNRTPFPSDVLAKYAAAGVQPVENDLGHMRRPRVIEADICSSRDNYIRHDSAKLRRVLRVLLGL